MDIVDTRTGANRTSSSCVFACIDPGSLPPSLAATSGAKAPSLHLTSAKQYVTRLPCPPRGSSHMPSPLPLPNACSVCLSAARAMASHDPPRPPPASVGQASVFFGTVCLAPPPASPPPELPGTRASDEAKAASESIKHASIDASSRSLDADAARVWIPSSIARHTWFIRLLSCGPSPLSWAPLDRWLRGGCSAEAAEAAARLGSAPLRTSSSRASNCAPTNPCTSCEAPTSCVCASSAAAIRLPRLPSLFSNWRAVFKS